MKKNIHT